MLASKTEVDSVDSQLYPDPLSIDFDTLVTTKVPSKFEIDFLSIQKPFLLTAYAYSANEAQYDDIVLSWNNVPHISKLQLEDVLYFPDLVDITSFVKGYND